MMLYKERMIHHASYHSTRSTALTHSFEDILLAGLAPDGGLYVPSHLPHLSPAEIMRLAQLPYAALAYEIIALFVGDVISPKELRTLIDAAYASFRHPAVTPLVQLDHQHMILELFHGETLAFKDVALQFLGRILDYVLQKRSEKLVILGATSGDTGSAAIAGCRGRSTMDVVILYPHGRVSEVQRRQMTTIYDDNVHCLAVDGTFDDCQAIVKTLFVDQEFRTQHPLGAVNSINWTRIIAQIVYYFYAAFRLGAPSRAVAFSVPTGNFGDIYAGFLAQRMGLPIHSLIIASNRNDILTRCLTTGRYDIEPVVQTLSPSMDIGVSSNFERLLYDLHDGDSVALAELMASLKRTGGFSLSKHVHQKLQQYFMAYAVDDATIHATMQQEYARSGMVIDPHTAVGVHAARQAQMHAGRDDVVYVTLATAHPAKFPDAVQEATQIHPALPRHLHDLYEKNERYTRIANDAEAVKAYIANI